MKKLIVVVVLAVLAGIVWKESSRGGVALLRVEGELRNTQAPNSPLHAQEQVFIDRFHADPALRERFAGTFSSKGLYAELDRAMRRGAQSLDGPVLVGAMTAIAALMPRLPEHSCAKLARPRDDFDRALSADITATLSRLPAVHHRRLWEFYLQ